MTPEQMNETVQHLRKQSEVLRSWIGPEGDDQRYKRLGAGYSFAADAIEQVQSLTAQIATAGEQLRGMREAHAKIATLEVYSEGSIPVTASELREIARGALNAPPTAAEEQAKANAQARDLLQQLLAVQPDSPEECELVAQANALLGTPLDYRPQIETWRSKAAKWDVLMRNETACAVADGLGLLESADATTEAADGK